MKSEKHTGLGLFAAALLLLLPAIAEGQPAVLAFALPDVVDEIGAQQAQGDTIYKAARKAMNQGDYALAVDLYRQSMSQEPQYAADALYYQALAYQKMGGRSNYRKALEALERQFEQYPDADTHNDALSLELRVQGELASQGDARAAEALAREAERMQRDMEREVQRELSRTEAENGAGASGGRASAGPDRAHERAWRWR